MFSRDQVQAVSLTEEDFVQIGTCRRPHNRLGLIYQSLGVNSQPRYDRAKNARLTFAYLDPGSGGVIHDQ
jgi:hypothetical protein